MNSSVLVIADNQFLFDEFREFSKGSEFANFDFEYRSTEAGTLNKPIRLIDLKASYRELIDHYAVIISLHCRQIFPKDLVKAVKCINVHPGLNPYNRGWYPHVFSIINKLPTGATIHEMNEYIDAGPIIVQEEVIVEPVDTSETLYKKIQIAEFGLIRKNLLKILTGDYETKIPFERGNFNTKKEFEKLRELDLAETGTAGYFIDRFRAMSHGDFKNLFITDPLTEEKIFLKIAISR